MCKVGALSIAGHPPCLQFQLQVTVPDWELYGDDAKGLYMLNSELAGRTYAAPSLVL